MLCTTGMIGAMSMKKWWNKYRKKAGAFLLTAGLLGIAGAAVALGSADDTVAQVTSGTGSSAVTTNYDSLAGAVEAAEQGDTITLLKSTSVTEDMKVNAPIVVSSAVTLTDSGAHTMSYGDGLKSAMFQVKGGSLTLAGNLTLTGALPEAKVADSLISTEKGTALTLNNGVTLKNHTCTSSSKGGAVTVAAGATLTINGASITGNRTAGSGGAIYATGNHTGYATVHFTAGEISDNTAVMSGGAVVLNQGAKMDMGADGASDEAAKITGNTQESTLSTSGGGAVVLAQGAGFTMYSGTIAKNQGASNGTIWLSGSSATAVLSGTIKENRAKTGGAVFMAASTNVTLAGATVTNNAVTGTTSASAGGVLVSQNANLTLSKTAVVTDNTRAKSTSEQQLAADPLSNIFLNGTNMTMVTDASFDGTVGVTTLNDGLYDISKGYGKDSDVTKHFIPDTKTLDAGVKDDGTVYLGYLVEYYPYDTSDSTFTGADSVSLSVGGTKLDKVSYVLQTNQLKKNMTPAIPDVDCDTYFQDTESSLGWYAYGLNASGMGQEIKRIKDATKLSDLKTTGALKLYPDWIKLVATIENNGTVYGKYASVTKAFGDTNTLKEGYEVVLHADSEITAAIRVISSVTLRSEAGKAYKITRVGQSAIFSVEDASTSSQTKKGVLHIDNVKLCGGSNKAYSIIMVKGGTVTLSGKDSEIYGMDFGSTTPNASRNGFGAVYVESGLFTMEAGSIHDNKMNGRGGGVYVAKAGVFRMKGGTITKNGSTAGSGVCVIDGTFSMTGGTITANEAKNSGQTKGIGIYTNTTIEYGGSASVTGNSDSAGANNIYLENTKDKDVQLRITSALEDSSVSGITMALPANCNVTKDLGKQGNVENFTSDSSNYAIGYEDGEVYLGFGVTYYTNGGYFEEDEAVAADQRQTSKTIVVRPNQTPVLPKVFHESKGFENWTYEQAGNTILFDENTTVQMSITAVSANWGTTNVTVSGTKDGTNYTHSYVSLRDAVADSRSGDTINVVTNNLAASSGMVIRHSVTITGDTLIKTDDGILFTVEDTEKEDIRVQLSLTLDGNQTSGSVLKVVSGEVDLSGTVIQNVAAADAQDKAYGQGALYVAGGEVNMRSGSKVQNNKTFGQGAGIYIESGSFVLHTSAEITENEATLEGGGIYVGKEGTLLLRGGTISGNKSGTALSAPRGSGIFSAGTLHLGDTSSTTEITVKDNPSAAAGQNNLALADGCKMTFDGALSADSRIGVSVENPSQDYLTSGFAQKATIGTREQEGTIQSDDTSLTLAYDTSAKELYIGYQVTYELGASVADGAYFTDEESLPVEDRNESRLAVIRANTHPKLPDARNGRQALGGWYQEDDTEITKDSYITGDMTLKAKWVGAQCRIGEMYYATLSEAVAVANQKTSETVIELLSQAVITEPLLITANVKLTSEIVTDPDAATRYGIARAGAVTMIRVSSKGKCTLENISLNGNSQSFNLVYVDGGVLTIGKDAKLTGCNNEVRNESILESSGPGTVYVANGGRMVMTAGEITANHSAWGAAVYVSDGKLSISGGSITKNQCASSVGLYSGIYLGANQMSISGNPVIADNTLANGAEQNVYFTSTEGVIEITDTVTEGARIGVTSSVGPTGIEVSGLIAVTKTINSKYLADYPRDAIFSDDARYEAVVNEDISQVCLRKGHTVTFEVEPGQTLIGNKTKDVVDGEMIGTLPSASYGRLYFDGWYTKAGEKLTESTVITESMTVTPLFTEGLCATPVATPTGGKHCVGEANDTLQVTLSTATEGADIYYTLDGSQPEKTVTVGGATMKYGDAPISLAEDAVLRAIAVKKNYSTSGECKEEYYICYVKSIKITTAPDTVFRGYDAEFAARVTVGNQSTSKDVTWSIVGDYEDGTTIDPLTGVLSVDSKELAEEVTIVAHSEDPDKTAQVTVPIKDQYRVIYDKNTPAQGIVTGSVGDSDSPYLSGSTVTVLANGQSTESNRGFACSGYTFSGWNTKADGSGTAYQPGDTFEILEDTTLYAQWQVVISISSFSISPKSQTVKQGEEFTFHAQVRGTGNLTGEATWELIGNESEHTKIDETGTIHVDKEESAKAIKVRATSKDITSYWAEATVTVALLTRYQLRYNAAGGRGDMTSEENTYISGTEITVADCSFVREGYDFVCWNTAVNGNGAEVKPGDTYVMNQDVTMYVQWKRKSDYVPDEDPKEEDTTEETPHVKTDKEYAEETIALIDAIGDVTKNSKAAIDAARASYNALTDTQKALVGDTEYQKLLLRERLYYELLYGKTTETGQTIIPEKQTTSVVAVKRYIKPVAKGKKFKAGAYQYKVTRSSLKNGTVTVVRPLSKKIKKATIPAKVTYNQVTYKVTAVSKQAFKGCKKLKKVTIGKNVTTLGSRLFYKTGKVEAVVLKTRKLKKIAKNSMKDLSDQAYIKMPDKKYRKYEKLLQKSRIRSDIRLKTW